METTSLKGGDRRAQDGLAGRTTGQAWAGADLRAMRTEYEFVYRGKPIKDVLRVALVPRGNTALLDAVGRAIIETGERLAATES